MVFENLPQIEGRIGIRPVDPDADIVDGRGVLRLEAIRRAGEQGHPSVGAQIEALKKDKAEGVVPGEIEHALLAEHEQPVEAALLHGGTGGAAPAGQFLTGKMQGHRSILQGNQ